MLWGHWQGMVPCLARRPPHSPNLRQVQLADAPMLWNYCDCSPCDLWVILLSLTYNNINVRRNGVSCTALWHVKRVVLSQSIEIIVQGMRPKRCSALEWASSAAPLHRHLGLRVRPSLMAVPPHVPQQCSGLRAFV